MAFSSSKLCGCIILRHNILHQAKHYSTFPRSNLACKKSSIDNIIVDLLQGLVASQVQAEIWCLTRYYLDPSMHSGQDLRSESIRLHIGGALPGFSWKNLRCQCARAVTLRMRVCTRRVSWMWLNVWDTFPRNSLSTISRRSSGSDTSRISLRYLSILTNCSSLLLSGLTSCSGISYNPVHQELCTFLKLQSLSWCRLLYHRKDLMTLEIGGQVAFQYILTSIIEQSSLG